MTRPFLVGRNQLFHIMFLLEQGNLHGAAGLLNRMEFVFKQKGLWPVRLVCNIMMAQFHYWKGDLDSALRYYKDAYDMAYNNDIFTPFIEFGDDNMVEIVSAAKNSEVYEFDVNWLNQVLTYWYQYKENIAKAKTEYEKEKRRKHKKESILTKREQQVLDYLRQGLNRNEIASAMDITIHAVKKHITGIYNKLGAVNRADAIYIATNKGII